MASGRIVVHQLLHGDGAVGKLPGMGVDDGSAVGIAVTVFHQDLATVDWRPKGSRQDCRLRRGS